MNDVPDQIVKPTKERLRHSIGHDDLTEAQPGGVVKKTGGRREWSNLEDLWRKRGITDEQYAAGQKYYFDHELAGFSPRVTSQLVEWIQKSGHSPEALDAAERRVFHQKRFAQANDILERMKCRKAMHWFVIDNFKLEAIGRQFWGYRGQRSASAGARVMAAMALEELARFYGLVK